MEIRNNCWNMQKTSGDWKLLPKGLSFANWSWRGNPSRSFTRQVKTALYRAWKIKIPLYDLFRFTVLTIWFSSLLPYSWQEDMSWGEPVPKKLLLLLNIQENGTSLMSVHLLENKYAFIDFNEPQRLWNQIIFAIGTWALKHFPSTFRLRYKI